MRLGGISRQIRRGRIHRDGWLDVHVCDRIPHFAPLLGLQLVPANLPSRDSTMLPQLGGTVPLIAVPFYLLLGGIGVRDFGTAKITGVVDPWQASKQVE